MFLGLGIKAPATGNDLTEPFNFNLMFQTSIGPTGQLTGFLRPETAQVRNAMAANPHACFLTVLLMYWRC